MKNNLKTYLFVLLIPIVFFLTAFFTISDYGISWDEPIHFTRGQAYLNYFLNGDLIYQNEGSTARRSHYQETSFTAQFFLKNDSGHPPLNGILAALSNLIFYQTLGILGDIESFHLFNILAATFLVFAVTAFATQAYGKLAGIVAGLVISLYPLFFAESHFNIKDPAEAAFFAATIWAFWNSLKRYDTRWLLAATIFFAFGLGTKFNILFLPFILIPWLLLRYRKNFSTPAGSILNLPRSFLILLAAAPFIIILLFFISWPYLWQDPINNTLNIFRYYKEIGTGGLGQPQYLIWGGFNLFPVTWISITTPSIILFLTILGIVGVVMQRLEKEKTALLWLIWLIVPVLRVSLPGSSIYGGVRQIMEFLPAMALLSGLGVATLLKFIKHRTFVYGLLLLSLIFHLLVLVRLHPNENVYFNSFIGGLQGAKKANIPYWGNSFGNAYYQAAQWLNKNAAPGSKVALVQGTSVNIPASYFSPQITYSNSFWSGINREGEYLVELTHQGNEIAYPFAWEYINRVLVPVHEVSVDGVAIAKIWKNDIEHSRPEYQNEQDVPIKDINIKGNSFEIELEKIFSLAKLRIDFNSKGKCQTFKAGTIQTSVDNTNWRTEIEKISDYQVRAYSSLEDGLVRFIFPVNPALFIRIQTESGKSCLFNNPKIEIRGFKV